VNNLEQLNRAYLQSIGEGYCECVQMERRIQPAWSSQSLAPSHWL